MAGNVPSRFPKAYGIKPLRYLFRFLLEIPATSLRNGLRIVNTPLYSWQ
jgi:hypothetical protein